MKKRLGLIIALACLMAMTLALPVLAAAEDEPTITITGNGIAQELTFTRTELNAMKDAIVREAYSTTNNFPTDKASYLEGVLLETLLKQAGMKEEATLIKAISEDGYYMTFTKDQLFGDRYSYVDNSAGKKVSPVIAIRRSEDGFGSMTEDKDKLVLVMGQKVPGEQNNPWLVKYLKTIEVTTAAPEQWESVTFNRAATPAGVSVTLKHSAGDSVKIYYTTDGKTPTVASKMYNISATRFQPQLNVPIVVSTDTEIKAIAIGPGKLDSEVTVCNVSFSGSTFMDLDGYDWAKSAIERLAEKEIINGKSTGFFAPADSLKRSEFAKMMVLALGEQPTAGQNRFSDVGSGTWYYGYVDKATGLGLLEGYPDGTFKPDKVLTKQEMVAIVIRAMAKDDQAMALTSQSEAVKPFVSETRISDWARNYIALAEATALLEHGHMVITGVGQGQMSFDGQGSASRAEAAYVTDRMLSE